MEVGSWRQIRCNVTSGRVLGARDRPGGPCRLNADPPKSQEATTIMSESSPPIPHRNLRAWVLMSLAGCSVVIPVLATPVVGADDSFASSALNGRFLVTSNGDWAKTNQILHNEQTVRQVWTITSSCVDSTTCSGKVTSSQGWSADLHYDASWWSVDRVVNNWQPCPDGTAAAGLQRYRFWGVDSDGQMVDTDVTLLAGSDTTIGKSGDCWINRPLMISLPLRLQKLD